jgi:phosphoadenosine phosphosulfate reductase
MTNPDLCCHIRKTEPLQRALAGFDAWFTGRKRFQSSTRAALPLFEADGERIKVNPLANWSGEELKAYAIRHALPEHPLVAKGYPSIGCVPCTTKVAPGEDARAGRWRGQDKIECGIHTALEIDGSGI